MTYPLTPGYSNDSTSKAAADKMPASTVRAVVLASLRMSPKTCEEAEDALGLSHQTVSARIRELAMSGDIEDSGARRENRSGRTAIVWQKKDCP